MRADARSIKAYAKTNSQQGDVAESSITISDKNKEASLFGYSNYAYSGSGIYSVAGQIINSAAGDHITINERARQFDGDTALARMNIANGQVDSYYGAARQDWRIRLSTTISAMRAVIGAAAWMKQGQSLRNHIREEHRYH